MWPPLNPLFSFLLVHFHRKSDKQSINLDAIRDIYLLEALGTTLYRILVVCVAKSGYLCPE